MTKHFKNDEQLVKAIHELPKSMEPAEDLWPGIAAGMAGTRGRSQAPARSLPWGHRALAASVAIAFVAGLMFGRQIGTDEDSPREFATTQLAMLGTLKASEQEYQAAFREFIPVGLSRNLLEIQAVENIENSWLELQQAETALLAALNEYPGNQFLNHKLLDLRAQQLGFMRQLATLDQFSGRRT